MIRPGEVRFLSAPVLRRWVRYPTCGTCGAQAGEPCTRFPPPKRVAPDFNSTPHTGRRRGAATDKCRLWGFSGQAPCAKVADHGGLYHCDEHGRRWRVDGSDRPVTY